MIRFQICSRSRDGASRDTGPRFQLITGVDDVDPARAELAKRRVALLNGPMNRPWGARTVSFPDPGGHIWEIARDLLRTEAS